ncbi:hypothetical protein CWC26_21270, partial [Pseudoalteromonas sp. S4488]|uniref:hypothetical protein n=1 Tax=Pseudoalteromonas sp. S4488 TaxID=579558 RepID=UPI001287FA04
EQRIENPRVGGSIPPLGTIFPSLAIARLFCFCLLQITILHPVGVKFKELSAFSRQLSDFKYIS